MEWCCEPARGAPPCGASKREAQLAQKQNRALGGLQPSGQASGGHWRQGARSGPGCGGESKRSHDLHQNKNPWQAALDRPARDENASFPWYHPGSVRKAHPSLKPCNGGQAAGTTGSSASFAPAAPGPVQPVSPSASHPSGGSLHGPSGLLFPINAVRIVAQVALHRVHLGGKCGACQALSRSYGLSTTFTQSSSFWLKIS